MRQMVMSWKVVRVLERRLRCERRAVRGGGRRKTDEEPNYGWIPAVVIALLIALADWGTKAWVASRVPLNHLEVVWEGRVAFWHVRNPAMILGLYGNLPLSVRMGIAALAGILAAILLFQVLGRGHRLPEAGRRWAWLFVGLSSGGMLGNLGERLVHWGVTDFLSIRWGGLWLPPGNIADLAILLSLPVAVVVIAFELTARSWRSERQEENEAPILEPTVSRRAS